MMQVDSIRVIIFCEDAYMLPCHSELIRTKLSTDYYRYEASQRAIYQTVTISKNMMDIKQSFLNLQVRSNHKHEVRGNLLKLLWKIGTQYAKLQGLGYSAVHFVMAFSLPKVFGICSWASFILVISFYDLYIFQCFFFLLAQIQSN